MNEGKYSTFPEKCTYPQHSRYNFRSLQICSPTPKAHSHLLSIFKLHLIMRSDHHSDTLPSIFRNSQGADRCVNCKLLSLPSQSVLSLGPTDRIFFFISGQGIAVLPLQHCSDFYLMKIVNHVASRVSAQHTEFVRSRSPSCQFTECTLCFPHSWLHLTGLY